MSGSIFRSFRRCRSIALIFLILVAFCLGTNFVYLLTSTTSTEAAAVWSASEKKHMIEKEAEIASLQSQIEQLRHESLALSTASIQMESIQMESIQMESIQMEKNKALSVTSITYYSSTWEKLWLDNSRNWQEHGICEAIAEQTTQVLAFMNGTCTARTDTPWCLIDDSVQQVWYHTEDGRVEKKRPSDIGRMSENAVEPVTDAAAAIWSYFEWTDPETGHLEREYIEPLVSHLRHPLARCKHGNTFLVDRSYVMPPSKRAKDRKAFLFDAGASSWNSGAGGPSLSYFAAVWQRQSIVWDRIEGWECATPEAQFYDTVPNEWKAKTVYHQKCISTTPAEDPFVPTVIRQQANKEDYVLFKLDIDSKEVETAIVDHLIGDIGDNDDLSYIDEFVWEQHVDNYLMASSWGKTQDMTKTIADSYDYFLRLRHKGVRAHSWV
ncbi:hypothetical protein ScalyP_jg1538 [Parmales sp. scaly parma]|nr:hypothetical protein ScalyP_jg1538 [Parmales sp. scaly parma]